MHPTTAQPSPYDSDRLPEWEESRRRRRMLNGTWMVDLDREMRERLNATRLSNMGRLDTSINLYRSTVTQIACLYDRTPIVRWDGEEEMDEDPADRMGDILRESAWWQMAPRHASYVVGLRDSAVHVGWSPVDGGRIRLRLVPPDVLEVETHPDDPTHLRKVIEWRQRPDPVTGEPRHYADVWDLGEGETPRPPSLTIQDEDGRDVTAQFLDEDPEWVWFDSEGAPFLPWVLYHAEPSGKAFDPYPLCELVDGAFFAALLWNLWHHVMVAASWEQRYVVDGELRGASMAPDGSTTAATITTAPTSVLLFRSDADRSATMGSWSPAVAPDEFAASVLTYQTTMVSTLGIHASDLARTSGSAQSGYAIQLRRSAQRRMARSMEPQFRRGDEALLATVAKVSNAMGMEALPEDGWTLTYQYVEDPVEERMAEHEYRRELAADGLLSRSEWYMLTHPGSTKDQAFGAILEAALESEALSRASSAMVIDEETAAAMVDAQDRAAEVLSMLGEDLPPEAAEVIRQIAAMRRRPTDDEESTA